ncbi:hypothetical protein T492DRAFT_1050658 [Pavlovales sp. CCMP2436]|nr:hypothetical protein T492DRAFT_1050658 [Pavlovales sp. CCMP2436]
MTWEGQGIDHLMRYLTLRVVSPPRSSVLVFVLVFFCSRIYSARVLSLSSVHKTSLLQVNPPFQQVFSCASAA